MAVVAWLSTFHFGIAVLALGGSGFGALIVVGAIMWLVVALSTQEASQRETISGLPHQPYAESEQPFLYIRETTDTLVWNNRGEMGIQRRRNESLRRG